MKLSQNKLKLIAAGAMFADHIGSRIFPQYTILRIVGRLAFPIFSYFIYEGFSHTRNRAKYLVRILFLGIICMAVYYVYEKELYGNILITFSLSIAVLYGADFMRVQSKKGSMVKGISVFLTSVLGAYAVCDVMYIDYGFAGVVAPLFAYLFNSIPKRKMSLFGFGIGIVILAAIVGSIQYYSLFALVLLWFYDGTRGKINLGRFFYWFYPLHIVAIELVANFI